MPAIVLSQARHPEVRSAKVRSDAIAILEAMEQKRAELTVVLVDDVAIHALNKRYRKKDAPTDVLAFAMREGMRAPGDEHGIGDVVISLETAARQARRRRKAVDAEVRTLLIHGILHLLGYDHERSETEAKRMKARERALARALAAA